MIQGASTFVIYRELEDGYRWRLRSDTGETLAAETAHPTESACEADPRAFIADGHPEAEVVDATAKDRGS